MGKGIAPWREGLVLKIVEGDQAGFTGEVVMIEDDAMLLVDRGTRETHWISISKNDQNFGPKKWFEWIETATTPNQVLDDLILDWNRSDMDNHWRYQDVVEVLLEAKERINNLAQKQFEKRVAS